MLAKGGGIFDACPVGFCNPQWLQYHGWGVSWGVSWEYHGSIMDGEYHGDFLYHFLTIS